MVYAEQKVVHFMTVISIAWAKYQAKQLKLQRLESSPNIAAKIRKSHNSSTV